MDKQFRLLAAEIVVSSKLPTSVKRQFVNFIKECKSDAQVKALLMDGEITKLDEQAENIVNQRWELSEAGGRVAKLRKSYMSTAGSGGGLNVFWLAYRKIRSMYDSCTKRCGTYELNTSRRQHCMIKCKVAKAKAELAAAQKAGKGDKIAKAKADLQKAEKILAKSKASFAKRGADE